MTRRYEQISKAFERILQKDGVQISFSRGVLTGTAIAVFTFPKYSETNEEGFVTTYTNAFFLMRRTDYHWTGLPAVIAPQPGDVITNTATGQKYRVIPRDEGRKVDDTPPEIDKIRIPVQPIR